MQIRQLVAIAGSAAAVVTGFGASAPAHAAPVRTCGQGDLAVSFRMSGGAAGSAYGYMRLKNISRSDCSVDGFGRIAYVAHRGGHRVGSPAVHVSGPPVSRVLKPGQRVRSLLQMTQEGNYPRKRCNPATVRWFRVYPPGSKTPTFVAHRTIGCSNPAVKLLHQRPYTRP